MENIARTRKQLGSIIRRYRKNDKLNQTQLGALAGLRQATISEIEKGNNDASIKTVMEILGALDLEIVVRRRTKSDHDEIEKIF